MDLYIQTLTGTLFELRVSPFETILSIKGKVQRLEGIPISQQHLIWKSIDLQDEYCLHDYGIKSGTTLTLVLAMRDGPINMRRVSVTEPDLHEIEEYMGANRDEIWEKLCDDKQVTLLVFRDGEQLNFYRIYDQSTDSLTPNSDSISSPSAYNNPELIEHEKLTMEKYNENEEMRNKVDALREKLENVKLAKKKKPRPPSAPRRPRSKLRSDTKRHISKEGNKTKPTTPLATSEKRTSTRTNRITQDTSFQLPHPPVLPPVRRNSKAGIPTSPLSIKYDNQKDCSSACSSCTQRRKLPSIHDMSERISRLNKSREKGELRLGSRSRRHVLKPLGNIEKDGIFDELTGGDPPLPEIGSTSAEVESYKKLLSWMQPKSNDSLSETSKSGGPGTISMSKRNTPELSISSRLRSVNFNSKENLTHLPPVHQNEKRLPPSLSGKKRVRCVICTKKLGIASTYQCRCGGKFCASHRYPETHSCSYDYKSEGRKYLAKNNPVVAAPKLPKI